jgi:hypothetical protein
MSQEASQSRGAELPTSTRRQLVDIKNRLPAIDLSTGHRPGQRTRPVHEDMMYVHPGMGGT